MSDQLASNSDAPAYYESVVYITTTGARRKAFVLDFDEQSGRADLDVVNAGKASRTTRVCEVRRDETGAGCRTWRRREFRP